MTLSKNVKEFEKEALINFMEMLLKEYRDKEADKYKKFNDLAEQAQNIIKEASISPKDLETLEEYYDSNENLRGEEYEYLLKGGMTHCLEFLKSIGIKNIN